jgi:hypothetical protein
MTLSGLNAIGHIRRAAKSRRPLSPYPQRAKTSQKRANLNHLLNNLHGLWSIAIKPAINTRKIENHENYLRGLNGEK